MKKIQPKDIWLLVAQVLLLSLIMLSPALISYISSGDSRLVVESMWIAFYWLAPAMCLSRQLLPVYPATMGSSSFLAVWSSECIAAHHQQSAPYKQ